MSRNYLRKKYSDEELRDLLLSYFEGGYTVKQTADAIGSTERSVQRWKREFGLTSEPLKLSIDVVVSEHASGYSANDIAKKHGVCVNAVIRRLQKRGIHVSRGDAIGRKNRQRHDALWPEIEFDLNNGSLKSEIVHKYKISAPSLNILISRHEYKPSFVGDMSDVLSLLDGAHNISNMKRRRSTIEYLTGILEYVGLYQVKPTATDLSRYMGRSIQTVYSWFNTNGLKHLLSDGSLISYNVREICRNLSAIGVSYELNNRAIIDPFEIDIWIPDFNLGIEVNPSTTHTVTQGTGTKVVAKDYHQMKSLRALNAGIRLVHVFDWDDISVSTLRFVLTPDSDTCYTDDRLILDLNKMLVTGVDLQHHGYMPTILRAPTEYLVNRNNSKITSVIDRNTISVFDAGNIVYERSV